MALHRRGTRHDRAPPAEPEAPVRLEEDLRRPRPAVVGRDERGRVGAGVGDGHEVAAPQRRQVVGARARRSTRRSALRPGSARGAGRRPSRPPGPARSGRRSGGGRRTAPAGSARSCRHRARPGARRGRARGGRGRPASRPGRPASDRARWRGGSAGDPRACASSSAGSSRAKRSGAGPGSSAGGPGTRRRGRACRTSRSSRARAPTTASASPDGVAPRVHRAELRADVQVDAARPQRPVRRRRPASMAVASVSVIPNFEAPAPTASPASVSGATSGLSRYSTSSAVGRRARDRAPSHARPAPRLLGRFERDPPQRLALAAARAAARRSASVLPMPSRVIRSSGTPARRASAHSPRETTFAPNPRAATAAMTAGTSLALTEYWRSHGSGNASRTRRGRGVERGEVGDEDRRPVAAARRTRRRGRGDAGRRVRGPQSGTTSRTTVLTRLRTTARRPRRRSCRPSAGRAGSRRPSGRSPRSRR